VVSYLIDDSSKVKIVKKTPDVQLLSPENNYMFKRFVSTGIVILFITIGIMIIFGFMSVLPYGTEEGNIGKVMLNVGYLLTVIVTSFLVIYNSIGTPWLIRTLSYEITEDALIVRRGRITKVEIFVPYRTITNIGIVKGPIDRLFHIGHINIETAGTALGFSGKLGVDQYIEGLNDGDLKETYDFIYSKMKKLKDVYSTTTEEISIEKEVSLVEVIQELITEIKDLKRTIEDL
jgi:membrane protein YdbS with pleckstrin-like domain